MKSCTDGTVALIQFHAQQDVHVFDNCISCVTVCAVAQPKAREYADSRQPHISGAAILLDIGVAMGAQAESLI